MTFEIVSDNGFSEDEIILTMRQSQVGDGNLATRFQVAIVIILVLGIGGMLWYLSDQISRYILFTVTLVFICAVLLIILFDFLKRLINSDFLQQQVFV